MRCESHPRAEGAHFFGDMGFEIRGGAEDCIGFRQP